MLEQYIDDIKKVARAVWKCNPVVRSVLGDFEDAEQQALLYCLKYKDRYWKKDIPENKYYKCLARRGLWEATDNARNRQSGPKVYIYTPPERGYDHYNTVDDKEEVSHLMRILSNRQKETVNLHFLQGMSMEEVGSVLGISEGTVGYHTSTAIGKMRSLVG